MNVGDLVRYARPHRFQTSLLGVLLEKVHDPLARANDVFRVLWHDGKIGNNVWDYDLEVASERR